MKIFSITLLVIISFISCKNENKPSVESNIHSRDRENTKQTDKETGLPFIGKRGFETRPGASGTGTPHRFVEIKANGDVFFCFEQQNQADGTITAERYYAGKYTRYMKCFFKKWDNETTYYEFAQDTIYEIDANKKRIESEECCGLDEAGDKKCICKGELFTSEK